MTLLAPLTFRNGLTPENRVVLAAMANHQTRADGRCSEEEHGCAVPSLPGRAPARAPPSTASTGSARAPDPALAGSVVGDGSPWYELAMLALPSKLRRVGSWLTGGHRFTAIAMAVTVLYYVVIWGPFQGKASGDGWFAFLYLKAIVFHGSLDMKLVAPDYLRFFGESGPGHHMPNRCPVGPTFVWLPFYLIVAIPELIGIKLGLLKMTSHSGQSPVHIWVAGIGTLVCLLVGWRALLQLYARHVESSAAELGAAVTVWATPMLWYTAHQPFYQHGIAFCIVSVMIEYWDRTRGQSHFMRFVYLGALGGYGVSVRAQELVWLAPFAIECAWNVLRGPNRGRWCYRWGAGSRSSSSDRAAAGGSGAEIRVNCCTTPVICTQYVL